MTVRVGIPDLVSPSYLPVVAAVELGCFEREGVDATLELVYPVTDAADQLRRGELDYLGGAAHAPLAAYGGWEGWSLLAAQSRFMYWFLVVRSDLGIERGDLPALAGLRIGAAPGPVDGLRAALAAAGVDPDADVALGGVPGTGRSISFGVTAAKALERGDLDGFWANGMAKEVAVSGGYGTVVLDARRDPGPHRHHTFAALLATDERVRERPDEVAAATRAVVAAQRALADDPSAAARAAARTSPPDELALIGGLVAEDAPFYDPAIDELALDGLVGLADALGVAPATGRPAVAAVAREVWS